MDSTALFSTSMTSLLAPENFDSTSSSSAFYAPASLLCPPEFDYFSNPCPSTMYGNHPHANNATPSPPPRMGDLSDADSDLDGSSPVPVSFGNSFAFFGDQFQPANFINMGYGVSPMVALQGTNIAAPQPLKLKVPKAERMDPFPAEQVSDFKHVIYNLLVEFHNNPDKADSAFVQPCTIEENGQVRVGFCFNQKQNPEKRLPELYAYHIRKSRLELEDPTSIFIQDLYKFYLRASLELLSKYFEKRGKYTFLYEDLPLFKSGCTLEEAEERIKNMRTRARMQKKRKTA